MNKSIYIARLIGPVLLVMAIGMALGLQMEGDSYSSLLKEFIGSRALIFITGILALTAGLAGVKIVQWTWCLVSIVARKALSDRVICA